MAAYEPQVLGSPKGHTADVRTFDLNLTFGSAALASSWGKNLTVTRTSAGKYTIVLPRTYRRFVSMRSGWIKCAAGAVYFPVVLTDSSATAGSTGGGSIIIETRTEAGTATDPASGDILSLELSFSNDVQND